MASHKGFNHPGPSGPVLRPSFWPSECSPSGFDMGVERVARTGSGGSCVGSPAGTGCSAIAAVHASWARTWSPGLTVSSCQGVWPRGLAVAQEERDTDSGASTLPATPLPVSTSSVCPCLHPGALLAPVALRALSPLALPLLGLGFPPCSLPSHSPNPSPLLAGLAGLASPSLSR